jgi:hypothetical protein
MKKKKLTKKQKVQLIAQGICWKCGSKDIEKSKKFIKCNKCNLEILK